MEDLEFYLFFNKWAYCFLCQLKTWDFRIIKSKSSNQSSRLICLSFLYPLDPTTVTQVPEGAHHDCQHTQWVVSQERNIELEEFTAITARGSKPALDGDVTTSLKAACCKYNPPQMKRVVSGQGFVFLAHQQDHTGALRVHGRLPVWIASTVARGY